MSIDQSRSSLFQAFFSRGVLASAALAAGAVVGCGSDAQSAEPQRDPCIEKLGGAGKPGLWAIVDGPPACATTNPTRPEGDDTLIYFSGDAWNKEAARCRATDIFFGATPINEPDLNMDGVPDVTIEGNFEVPLDAVGYCLINEGTPSEIIMYSTCGLQTAGEGACEQTLPKTPDADITTKWFNCPGGPACAPKSDDACLAEAGDGKAYAAYVDDTDFFCSGTKQQGELTDAQDTIIVITGTRYKLSSALCLAAGPYNLLGVPTFGVGPLSRIATREASGLPVLDPNKDPVPNDITDGYCLFNKGLAEEFALYSVCNGEAPVDAVDVGIDDAGAPAMPLLPPKPVLNRKQRCAGYKNVQETDGGTRQVSVWGNRIPTPRHGEWVDCPGGPLCKLPLKDAL